MGLETPQFKLTVHADYGNKVDVHLMFSKTRVAPLKPLTIPRKELLSALFTARLITSVRSALENFITISSVNCWLDSSIALHWVTNNENEYKPYIENRRQEICKIVDPSLGIPTSSFGNFLVPLILNKLPRKLRVDIGRKFKSPSELWQLDDLLKTFKEELTARETARAKPELFKSGNKKRFEPFRNQSKPFTSQALYTGRPAKSKMVNAENQNFQNFPDSHNCRYSPCVPEHFHCGTRQRQPQVFVA